MGSAVGSDSDGTVELQVVPMPPTRSPLIIDLFDDEDGDEPAPLTQSTDDFLAMVSA
jgi:hypothetical protein